jgi:Gpi18-like mannosyltransferase
MKAHFQKLNQAMISYPIEILIMIFLFSLGLFVRLDLANWISGDYVNFLKPWMQQIVAQGGWPSLGNRIGDYTPAYMYLLTALSYFPQPNTSDPFLYGIKWISIMFDVLLVFAVYLNAKLWQGHRHPLFPVLIALIVFWLPTIIINGAIWGQIDASYTALSLLALYYLQKEKPFAAALWYGVAISFKLQAIFFLPVFIIIFWFRYRSKIFYILFIPLMYYVIALPTLLAGRSFMDVTLIYVDQTEAYPWLTLNMPNLYQWFPEQRYDDLSGFAFGLFMVTMAISFLGMLLNRVKVTNEHILFLTVWSIMMANFLLPSMHERYLYGADVAVILLVWQKPRYVWMAIVIQAISFFAYTPYIFGMEPIAHEIVAVGFAFAIIIMNVWIWQLFIPAHHQPLNTI